MEHLQGVTVLVTRPRHQAESILCRLQDAGAEVIAIPAIEIQPVDITSHPHFPEFDFLFFISANAVRLAPISPAANLKQVVAIGSQTAKALQDAGFSVSVVPDSGFTTEDLLADKCLQDLSGQRCLIVRGEGGRETLREQLELRGATVEYLDVYRRVPPVSVPRNKWEALRRSKRAIGMFTSAESVENFSGAIPEDDRAWFGRLPLIVGSQRIASIVQRSMNHPSITVADDPSDNAMMNALMEWAKNEANRP